MSKQKAYKDFTSKMNPNIKITDMWRTIKWFSEKTPTFHNIKALKKPDGNITTTSEDIGEILAAQFSNISSNLNYSIEFLREKNIYLFANYSPLNLTKNAKLIEEQITNNELHLALKPTKDKSPGPDRIMYSMIKNAPETLTTFL